MILKESDDKSVSIALDIIKSNNLLILPTDTIYGIAADANSDIAIRKIYDLKKRSNKKPIAIFLKNIQEIEQNFILNDLERKIIRKYTPGAITIILKTKKNSKFSKLLNQNDDSLAVRIPEQEFCLKLLVNYNNAIAVSSSNMSGEKEINDVKQLQKKFKDKINLIVEGRISDNQISSTIVKIESGQLKILRQGLVRIEI
jgi:L-threonylcarbamoyladenylate synthase